MKKQEGHLPIHTYADSTARHISQNALTSDVDVMPGASIGNLLNAAEVNEDNHGVPNLLFIAGQNTVQQKMADEEFLWGRRKKRRKG